MANYGFKDMRGEAELLLSPARPAGRISIGTGTLRLDIGGKVDIPGVLTKANQLTGALRGVFGAAVAIKQTAQMISGLVHQTVNDFDRLRQTYANGFNLPPIGVTIGRELPIPGVQSFFQFSALRPGQPIPAAYQSILSTRRRQLEALGARISSLAAATGLGGVTVTENYQRTPYPLEEDVDKPSVSKLAVGGQVARQDDILKDKAKFVVAGVPVAAGKPSFWSRFTSLAQIKSAPGFNATTGQLFKDRKSAAAWSEPPSNYASQFPYNKVQASDSGHVIEIDDTPGAERLHIFHRSGSFVEWHPNGTVVYKNMKDGYFITMNNQFIKVAGNCHISVDGNATIYAKKDLSVQSDGEINFQAKKDFNVYASNINLRAKKTFKADGLKLDLRYINLPTGIHPVMGALVPRINLAALRADYPRGNFNQVLAIAATAPLDPRTVGNLVNFQTTAMAVPLETPLSNPQVYAKKTAAARDYRARFFDTPEETQNFEIYTAHIDLQKQLGDVPANTDSRALRGELTQHDTTVPAEVPTVTYLNFDDYKGRFTYPPNTVLGTSSFTLRDLVDTALFPDVVSPMREPTSVGSGRPVDPDTDSSNPNSSSTPRPGGGSGASGQQPGRGGRAGEAA